MDLEKQESSMVSSLEKLVEMESQKSPVSSQESSVEMASQESSLDVETPNQERSGSRRGIFR